MNALRNLFKVDFSQPIFMEEHLRGSRKYSAIPQPAA